MDGVAVVSLTAHVDVYLIIGAIGAPMHSVRITSTSFCTSTSVRRIELWLSGCCYCYTTAAKRQARCKRKPLPRRGHVYVGLRRSDHDGKKTARQFVLQTYLKLQKPR